MRRKSKASMMELKGNMTLAPVEGVKIDESLTFSMEIPLQMLFDQFTTFISKTDFKDIAWYKKASFERGFFIESYKLLNCIAG